MMFDRPADVPLSAAEIDMHARLVPAADARERAREALAGKPRGTIAVLALALPGKTRGVWVTGQEVVTLPVMWLAMEYDHQLATSHAEVAANGWLRYAGRAGTVAYAMVYQDGECSMWEGFANLKPEALTETT